MKTYIPPQDPLAQPDIVLAPRQIEKCIKVLPMINLNTAKKQFN